MKAMCLGFVAPVALAVALSGCSPGPVVTVSNLSASPLANVVVSGGTNARTIGTLLPGDKRSVTLTVRGETMASVAFDVGGRHIDSSGQTYVEGAGGYQVALNVQPDFQVTSVADIKGY
jgi:hypothetical protein